MARKPNFTKAEQAYRVCLQKRASVPRGTDAFKKADEQARVAYAKFSAAATYYGIPI